MSIRPVAADSSVEDEFGSRAFETKGSLLQGRCGSQLPFLEPFSVRHNDISEASQMENEVDEMDAEQTWPTEEELAAATEIVKVPKGTDPALAAWYRNQIDDDEGSEGGEDEEGGDEMESDDGGSEMSEPPEEQILDESDDDDGVSEAGGETMAGGEEFLSRRSRYCT